MIKFRSDAYSLVVIDLISSAVFNACNLSRITSVAGTGFLSPIADGLLVCGSRAPILAFLLDKNSFLVMSPASDNLLNVKNLDIINLSPSSNRFDSISDEIGETCLVIVDVIGLVTVVVKLMFGLKSSLTLKVFSPVFLLFKTIVLC